MNVFYLNEIQLDCRISQGRRVYKGKFFYHIVWDYYNPNDKWKKGDVIHHIDENTLNDDISNLEKMTNEKHVSIHNKGEKSYLFGKDRSGKNNPMFGVHRYGEDSPHYGCLHSKEAKEKQRNAKLGTKQKEETKEKQRLASLGENNGMYGRNHREETKQLQKEIRLRWWEEKKKTQKIQD